MQQLEYAQSVSQGVDLGAGVCTAMAKQPTSPSLGIHINLPGSIPPDLAKALQAGGRARSDLSPEERRAYDQRQVLFAKRRAYAQMMGTSAQTLYGLVSSPIGLATWRFDHGAGYCQPAAAAITSAVLGRTINGHSTCALTQDDVLDDLTLYWLANKAVSAAPFDWESHFSLYSAADVSFPAAVSIFPGENYQARRSWAERAYYKLIYFNQIDKDGHYAAWEQPELSAPSSGPPSARCAGQHEPRSTIGDIAMKIRSICVISYLEQNPLVVK